VMDAEQIDIRSLDSDLTAAMDALLLTSRARLSPHTPLTHAIVIFPLFKFRT
jgi:hypothetical protein